MLTFKNIQAVVVRLILSFITNNAALINANLEPILNKNGKSILLWDRFGVIVSAYQNDKQRWLLCISQSPHSDGLKTGTYFEIKLGNNETPFNKRVINGLNVWYHSNIREDKTVFDNVVTNGVNQLDIRPYVKDITWLDRLTGKVKEHQLSVGNGKADQLFDITVSMSRSLIGNLSVVVNVSTPTMGDRDSNWTLEKLFPVHFGVLRKFDTRTENEPVNNYVRDAILDHLEHNLS